MSQQRMRSRGVPRSPLWTSLLAFLLLSLGYVSEAFVQRIRHRTALREAPDVTLKDLIRCSLSTRASSSQHSGAAWNRRSRSQELWEACTAITRNVLSHPLIVKLPGTLPKGVMLAFVSATEAQAAALVGVLERDWPVVAAHLREGVLKQLSELQKAAAKDEVACQSRDGVLEGSASAVAAVVRFIEREGTGDRLSVLVLSCAILRLVSTVGHTMEEMGAAAADEQRATAARALSSVDGSLAQLESELDGCEGGDAGREERLYRGLLALVFSCVDVLGYEAGLRGSTDELTQARRQAQGAAANAAAKQTAALAAAAAYRKSLQLQQPLPPKASDEKPQQQQAEEDS